MGRDSSFNLGGGGLADGQRRSEAVSLCGDGSPQWARATVRGVRRAIVLVVGIVLVLFGALVAASFVFIPAGLAVLATEFPWAHAMCR